MTCSRCGATNAPGVKFCPACGNGLPPERAAAMPAPTPADAGMPGYNLVSEHLMGAPAQSTTMPRTTNGLSIAALVLGIVWVYWIGSILALIFGYVALGQIRDSGGTQGGRGMAIAGIVLGWVGVGMLCLVVVAVLLGASGSM
jgi:hypothetical protein